MGSEKLGRLCYGLCECAVAAESNNGADDDVDDD